MAHYHLDDKRQLAHISGRSQLYLFHDGLHQISDRKIYPIMDQRCVSQPLTHFLPKCPPPPLTNQSFKLPDLPSKVKSAIETAWGSTVPDLVACLADGSFRKSLTDIVASLLRMVKDLAQAVATLSRDIVKSLGPDIIIGLALVIVACLIY
jgi:hypothetical protein